MRCELFAWVARQTDLSLNLQGFLLRLVALADEDGRITLTQVEIARGVGLSERQTRTLLKEAATAKAIVRTRRGGAGAGRICDAITFSPEATGNIAPVATQPAESATDQPVPVACGEAEATGNSAQPAIGSDAPEATATGEGHPVNKSEPPCIGTGARAELEPNKLHTSETLPETEEDVGEGGVGEEGAPRPLPSEMTERMRFDAAKMGFKNGSGEEQFRKWREWHSAKRKTVINFEQSFRNWLKKALEFKGRRQQYREADKPSVGRKGFRLAGYGPDGQPRYIRDHRAGR